MLTKKNTLGLAVLIAQGVALNAHAQTGNPNVELYGVVDAGITRVSGLAGGSVTQLASGIMEGTRWGLKGNEDLGGGYRALFTLESRVEVDTGASSNRPISGSALPARLSTPTALGLPNAFPFTNAVGAVNAGLGGQLGVNLTNNAFDRQAYLGLITPVGAVIAGRQYTPAYEVLATFDSMKTESALAAGQLGSIPSAIDIRLSNTVQYRIQLGGVSASAMVGLGENATSNSYNRFVGAMAMYKGDGYSVGLGYNSRNNELGQKSMTNTMLGGSLALGGGTLSALYGTVKDKNPSNLSNISVQLTAAGLGAIADRVENAYAAALKQDATLFHIGYRMPFGANTVTLSFNSLNDKTAANADTRSYGVAYNYALSKRTDLNAILARVNNSANAQVALGGNGYLGGVTRAPGVDSTSVAFGIRHRF